MKKETKSQRTKFHFVRGRAQNKVCALVTKDMTISEVLRKYPKTIFVFLDYGLHCVGCPMAQIEQGESIEEAAKLHRIDLEKFLKDINKAAEKI